MDDRRDIATPHPPDAAQPAGSEDDIPPEAVEEARRWEDVPVQNPEESTGIDV